MTVKRMKKQNAKVRRDAAEKKLRDLNSLPNTYKFAAEALKTMSARGGSASSVVVSKYKSYNYKFIYALVMNTVKNIKVIKKLIEDTKLDKRVPMVTNPFLLEILVGDLMFGRGLKAVEQNSSAAAVTGLKEVLKKRYEAIKNEFCHDLGDEPAKYLRINHLKANLDHVISQLKTVGLTQLEYLKDKIKFKKFINKYRSMEDNQFMLDFHFPDDLIVLKPSAAEKLKKMDLTRKGKAMLQDKASFMAVEALEAKPGQNIIDACFAPGCKTSLIATKLKNKGKIFCFDIDKKRLVSAIHLLKLNGASCTKIDNQDFSKVKLNRLCKANKIDKFDAVLLDPSCSGSGIKSRIDYSTTKEHVGRLKKLQAFQVSLLKHALKSNSCKSIVYCTCSTSMDENEQVVDMALNESGSKQNWDVVEVLPYWQARGLREYEFGPKCLRSGPDNLTNGFFIAKLVRNASDDMDKDHDEDSEGETNNSKQKRRREKKPATLPELNEAKSEDEDEDEDEDMGAEEEDEEVIDDASESSNDNSEDSEDIEDE